MNQPGPMGNPIATLAVACVFGLITGAIAKSKNRNVFVWFFFGAVMFILALPAALLMKPIEPEY